MQYTAIFHGCKMLLFRFFFIFFLFLLKTLIVGTRLNRLSEAVLTSTHNLCFEAKIRKNVYPCKPQIYYIKVGCKGVFVTRTCVRDGLAMKNLFNPPSSLSLSVSSSSLKYTKTKSHLKGQMINNILHP